MYKKWEVINTSRTTDKGKCHADNGRIYIEPLLNGGIDVPIFFFIFLLIVSVRYTLKTMEEIYILGHFIGTLP